MTEATSGGGADVEAIGREIVDRIAERLGGFEERMAGLESDLRAEVGRVRSSAQVIDLLVDEVRRAQQEPHVDARVLERLTGIERAVRDGADAAPPIDLGPVNRALADVLEAVAGQAEGAEADRRVLHESIGEIRRDLSAAVSELGPTDLTSVTAALGDLQDRLDATPAVDIDPLHQRLDALADHVTASAPRPVDLSGVTSSIVGLHRRIDALASEPAVDLTGVTSSIAELHGHVDELAAGSAVDLAPVHEALAEIVDGLAGQIEDSRAASRSTLTAIAAIADRVDASPTTDLTPLEQRLDALSVAVDAIRPEATDLAPLHQRLDALAEHVTASVPRPVDLTGVTTAIDDLRRRLDEMPAGPTVDLLPVHEALAEVVDAVAQQIDDSRAASTSTLAAIEVLADRVDAQRMDLGPIEHRLTSLPDRAQIEELARRVDASMPDLGALRSSVDEVARQIVEQRPDLAPVTSRLDALATDLGERRPEPVDLGPVIAMIADLRTNLADSRPDLGPIAGRLDAIAEQVDMAGIEERLEALRRSTDPTAVRAGIAEVVEAGAVQLEATERTTQELRAAIDALTAKAAPTVDLSPVTRAVEGLRAHYDETQPDLDALIGAMTTLRTQILEAVDASASARQVDLQPVLTVLTGLEARLPTVDLDPIHARLDALPTHIPETDLQPLHAAIEALRASIPTPTDLDPVRADLASLVDAVRTIDLEAVRDEIATVHRSMPSLELQPVLDALAGLEERLPTVDLDPIHARLDALPTHIPETDLQPLHAAIEALRASIPTPTDLDPVRADLASLLDAVRTIDLATLHREIARVRESMPAIDLDPVLDAVAALRETLPTVDLAPLHDRLDSMPQQFPDLDLTPVERALAEIRASIPGATDLTPVHAAIDSLRADFPHVDLDPVRQDLHALRSAVAASQPDLTPVESSLRQVLDSLAQGITESRNATERVVRAVSDIEIPAMPDLSEARTDLSPVLDALGGIDRRLDDTGATDRLGEALRRVADDVSSARSDLAPAAAVESLATRIEALQGTVDALRDDEALREAELRLVRRVDANTEALRAKIDDQRALSDSLAANVSQLNATLTVASEEPQQLRRDLDRILEQLAERMGGAMRELRNELQSADEPLALRSSVEAGLDRITGRFQTDTGRILEAVAAAQDDADGRLRRIDNQVTELRRAVDRVRRDSDRLETVSPG